MIFHFSIVLCCQRSGKTNDLVSHLSREEKGKRLLTTHDKYFHSLDIHKTDKALWRMKLNIVKHELFSWPRLSNGLGSRWILFYVHHTLTPCDSSPLLRDCGEQAEGRGKTCHHLRMWNESVFFCSHSSSTTSCATDNNIQHKYDSRRYLLFFLSLSRERKSIKRFIFVVRPSS